MHKRVHTLKCVWALANMIYLYTPTETRYMWLLLFASLHAQKGCKAAILEETIISTKWPRTMVRFTKLWRTLKNPLSPRWKPSWLYIWKLVLELCRKTLSRLWDTSLKTKQWKNNFRKKYQFTHIGLENTSKESKKKMKTDFQGTVSYIECNKFTKLV